MPQKKLNESFAVRMFILMFCLMIGAGAVTFFLIAWATPSAYLTVISQDLRNQTDSLAKTLSRTAYHDWETVLNQFFRSSQAEFMLLTAGMQWRSLFLWQKPEGIPQRNQLDASIPPGIWKIPPP